MVTEWHISSTIDVSQVVFAVESGVVLVSLGDCSHCKWYIIGSRDLPLQIIG